MKTNENERKLNGVLLEDIFNAIEVLQNAGIDTTSVTMSLTHMLPDEEDEG